MWGANGWHMTGFGGIGGILIAIVTIVAIVWLVQRDDLGSKRQEGRPSESRADQEDSAMRVLRERFARGEIDAEEFEERKSKLT